MKRTFNRPSRDWQQYPSMQLPQRWPLVTVLQTRNTDFDKDGRLINAYAELDPQDKEYIVEKRPGWTTPLSIGSGDGRGHYNWRPNTGAVGIGGIYSAVGAQLFKNTVLHGAISNAGIYVFEPMVEGPYLFLSNALAAYYTDGTTLTAVTDPDFPASGFCLGSAYLNGRIYILRYDGGIQGSDVGAPGTWDPLNLIFARNNPDGGVTIAKQLSYIVAIKQWTTEFFEDVGNPTGSPLAVIQGAMLNYGCPSANTLVDIDGLLIWVTTSKLTTPQVGMLNNLNFEIISTPPVERLLRLVANWNVITVRSFPLKVGGHRFYVLLIETLDYSLVYDIDQKLWYYWGAPTGGVWPFGSCTALNDNVLLQRTSDGVQVTCDADYVYPTENGEWIPVDIYTTNFDYGVDRIKTLNQMRFNADQTPGSVLYVRYSDDDYQTWSNWIIVDLSQERPFISDLGSFYRRAFHFRHYAPTQLRIDSVDLQTDIGTG